MKIRIVVACCLVLSLCLSLKVMAQDPPPEPPPPPPGISDDDLRKLARDLEKTAERWNEATRHGGSWKPFNRIDPEMDQRLAAVIYDDKSVAPLRMALTGVKQKAPLEIYIINRLLEPLARATPEVNRAILPTVKTFYTKYQYKTFKPIANLAPYRLPPNATWAVTKKVTEVQERKMAEESEVLRHNQQVAYLGQQYFRTMARSNDPQTDKELKELIDQIILMESQGRAPWLDALKALNAMPLDEGRAATILKSKLADMENSLYVITKNYASRTKAAINRDDHTKFTEEPIQSGLEITHVMNRVRQAANQPARIVPTHSVLHAAGTAAANVTAQAAAFEKARRERNNAAMVAAVESMSASDATLAAFARIAGANVTPEQLKTIGDRATAQAKRLGEIRKGVARNREFDKACDDFAQQIFDSVLTPEQREACTPK